MGNIDAEDEESQSFDIPSVSASAPAPASQPAPAPTPQPATASNAPVTAPTPQPAMTLPAPLRMQLVNDEVRAEHAEYLTRRDALAKFKAEHFDWLYPTDGAARHRKVIAESQDPGEIKRELAIVAELESARAPESQARFMGLAFDLAIPMTAACEKGMQAALKVAESLQADARSDENELAAKYSLAPGSVSGISNRFESCKRELQEMLKGMHPKRPTPWRMLPTGQDAFWIWLGLPISG